MSAEMDSMLTVLGRSTDGSRTSLGGYSAVLKSVLTSVDLPSPDSPVSTAFREGKGRGGCTRAKRGLLMVSNSWERGMDHIGHTNYHDCKMEAFADRLAVVLVGQVGDYCDAGVSYCIDAMHRPGTGQRTHANDAGRQASSQPTYPASFLEMFARGLAVSGASWPACGGCVHCIE